MRRHRTSLSVNPLEGREVPACIVSYPNPETVLITGNAANDVVTINDNGASVVWGTATGAGVFAAAGIKTILVDTGDGSDRVYYRLVANLQAGQERAVGVDLGRGNDLFVGHLNKTNGVGSDLAAGSDLSITAHGGDGIDYLIVNADRDVDVAAGAKLELNLMGDAGNDVIRALYAGENDGIVAFENLDGGSGNDFVFGRQFHQLGSTGSEIGVVKGGVGNDRLYLLMFGASPPTLAQMDGGPGFDWAFGTPNVSKINVP